MSHLVSSLGAPVLKVGVIALLVNEIRGFILAAPVLYAMYRTGGTWTAMWLGFCALAGIAISVAGPLWVARRLNLLPARAN
jgi:hypothetical protein